MSATAEELVPERPSGLSFLWRRQLDSYPETRARVGYLAITVLATIMLYYELYVGGSVSTLILTNLHMSFTFYVTTLAFGNLIGAFGSLFAGVTDRLGRANLVVFGLFFTGIFVAFILPAATNKWVFTIEGFVVGVVEGICLVATPALIRDFSPQVGRATAMGFWTSGPVVGSLIVAVIGSATVPVSATPNFWPTEYRYCGYAGLVVFVIALIGLRELSPNLRDQLMVTMRDRALIEARAKGIDIAAALKNPFRQLVKADIIISALAVSLMLLIYYSSVGFAVIYLNSVFGFSVKDANGLGNWNWGFNVIAVILIGMISDRFRVRKPFMVIGGILGAVMVVVYLMQAGHHPSYYTMALILALLSFGLGVAYTPWMASFTETVEDRNPALTATGLAIWGWIIRIVIFAAFLVLPHVVTTVTPLVNYGATVVADAKAYPAFALPPPPPNIAAIATRDAAIIKFAQTHADIVALAQKDATQLANAQKFAPELKVIQSNPVLFTKLAKYKNPASIPPALVAQAIKAAGGGAKGLGILNTISSNQAAITGVIAVAPDLQKIAPFGPQLIVLQNAAPDLAKLQPYTKVLTAYSKVPPAVLAFMGAHAAAVQKAAADTGGQWKTWYWICFGGIIFFLLSIPLLRGRWRPSDARKDEAEHEAMVERELAALQS
ncbi:MAG TPA: MFS transporter [Streptosporangiaceae bacterium]|nr:MFS transporter [Streptosporangiaceae bacterium]